MTDQTVPPPTGRPCNCGLYQTDAGRDEISRGTHKYWCDAVAPPWEGPAVRRPTLERNAIYKGVCTCNRLARPAGSLHADWCDFLKPERPVLPVDATVQMKQDKLHKGKEAHPVRLLTGGGR